jgi:hypothetical protein
MAESAPNARVQAILIDMARTWMRLALEAEQLNQKNQSGCFGTNLPPDALGSPGPIPYGRAISGGGDGGSALDALYFYVHAVAELAAMTAAGSPLWKKSAGRAPTRSAISGPGLVTSTASGGANDQTAAQAAYLRPVKLY